MNISIAEQITSVEREIRMREKVYPRWVERKKLSQAKADHEMAAMHAVLETLRKVQVAERLL